MLKQKPKYGLCVALDSCQEPLDLMRSLVWDQESTEIASDLKVESLETFPKLLSRYASCNVQIDLLFVSFTQLRGIILVMIISLYDGEDKSFSDTFFLR